jgi:hypothetical protein
MQITSLEVEPRYELDRALVLAFTTHLGAHAARAIVLRASCAGR